MKEVDLADPIRAGGGENPKISDRWFSATSAPFSMILDVSGRSARVLFVSGVIVYIYESVGGRPPVGGRSKAGSKKLIFHRKICFFIENHFFHAWSSL